MLTRLIDFFSKHVLREYIKYLGDVIKVAMENNATTFSVVNLGMPQMFQTNSMYFLMNRYNSKLYQPDRVVDFSNFVFDLMRPNFRKNTTKALNLFQPEIGKRYNSILIYSEDTMKNLSRLRDTLNKLADDSSNKNSAEPTSW